LNVNKNGKANPLFPKLIGKYKMQRKRKTKV